MSIHKKLIVSLCFFTIAATACAQKAGQQPVQAQGDSHRKIPAKRDYASFVEDFKKRYPDFPIQAKPPQKQQGMNRLPARFNNTYEALRRQLLQRYPAMQQLANVPSKALAPKAQPRTYEWCMENLLPKIQEIQKMQEAAQE